MELKLGDKIWMHFGPSALIVGHVLDHSPDYRYIAISPVPYEAYRKMQLLERAQIPLSWHPIEYCSYICHIPYEDLQKIDQELKPHAGFVPVNGNSLLQVR
jgi:hypothetical protein